MTKALKGKVTKDELYKHLAKEFEQKAGGLENQPLYKALTLEDLQVIAGIIDKRLGLEEEEMGEGKLEQNLAKLRKLKSKWIALKKTIKISDDTNLCFFVSGFERFGFKVVKAKKVLCKFSVDEGRGYDLGFTCFIEMTDKELEQGSLTSDLGTPFKTVAKEISEKGWAEKLEFYTSAILEALGN